MPRTDRRDSTRARRICFDTHKQTDDAGHIYMICRCGKGLRPDCGQRIDPARQRWRADHGITKWADGGEDTPENLFPVLEKCDVEFKAAEDNKELHKDKRIKERHYGIKRASRPMLGSRNSPFKKKMDGTVERR